MTGLTTTALAVRLAQAAVARLFQAVTGRRFPAVAAVLGQLVFQRADPILQTPNGFLLLLDHCQQLSVLSNHLHHQGDNGFFSLSVGSVDIFQRRYPQRFHGPIVAGSAI